MCDLEELIINNTCKEIGTGHDGHIRKCVLHLCQFHNHRVFEYSTDSFAKFLFSLSCCEFTVRTIIAPHRTLCNFFRLTFIVAGFNPVTNGRESDIIDIYITSPESLGIYLDNRGLPLNNNGIVIQITINRIGFENTTDLSHLFGFSEGQPITIEICCFVDYVWIIGGIQINGRIAFLFWKSRMRTETNRTTNHLFCLVQVVPAVQNMYFTHIA